MTVNRTSGLFFASFLIVAFSEQGFAQELSAGNNQTVKAGTVSVPLHGTSGMGPNAQYSWVQLAGPTPARLENGTTLNATASINAKGTYIFELTGKDGNTTKADRVTIQVEAEEGEGDDARQSGVTAYLGTAFDKLRGFRAAHLLE
jgi:K319-like protein